MHPRRLTVATVVLGALAALGGCAAEPSTSAEAPRNAGDASPAAPQEPATDRPERTRTVLYDDEWLVEEGVWWFSDTDDWPRGLEGFAGQRNGLLGARVRGALWVTTPALYGKFRLRVELVGTRPAVPPSCRDVVEVSVKARGPLTMGSFESFSDPLRVPPGDYRVRMCATDFDTVADETAEDEFDGDDYRLHSGRILLQLWPAPARPDAVIRAGSEFGRDQHARARKARL